MNTLFLVVLSLGLLLHVHVYHASAAGTGAGTKNARSSKHLARQLEFNRLKESSSGEKCNYITSSMTCFLKT